MHGKRRNEYLGKVTEIFVSSFNKELIRYKYAFKYNISDSDWKKIRVLELQKTPKEWKESVYNAYKVYSRTDLKEFCEYLTIKSRNISTFTESSKMVITAFVSAIITYCIDKLFEYLCVGNYSGMLGEFVGYVCTIVSLIIFVFVIFNCTYDRAMDDMISHYFYSDYYEVISNVIRDKKQKGKKKH